MPSRRGDVRVEQFLVHMHRSRPHGHRVRVDIAGAHPYWAYPFADVAVVHNGQLTNYHQWRRRLERLGTGSSPSATRRYRRLHRREVAQRHSPRVRHQRQPHRPRRRLTYVVVTEDALGVAKDVMAAKPLVLYEPTTSSRSRQRRSRSVPSSTTRSNP